MDRNAPSVWWLPIGWIETLVLFFSIYIVGYVTVCRSFCSLWCLVGLRNYLDKVKKLRYWSFLAQDFFWERTQNSEVQFWCAWQNISHRKFSSISTTDSDNISQFSHFNLQKCWGRAIPAGYEMHCPLTAENTSVFVVTSCHFSLPSLTAMLLDSCFSFLIILFLNF